jgi:hypothetical protein
LLSQDPRKTVGFDLPARIAQGGLLFKRNIKSGLQPFFNLTEKIMGRLTAHVLQKGQKMRVAGHLCQQNPQQLIRIPFFKGYVSKSYNCT